MLNSKTQGGLALGCVLCLSLCLTVAAQDPPPLNLTPQPIAGPPTERDFNTLQQRVIELELMFRAQEDATRQVIRQSFLERGSKVNDFVTFGGSLEVLAGEFEDFDGVSGSDILLNTAELEFEIALNSWARTQMILAYDDGTSLLFPTTEDFDGAFIDRINVDTAFLFIGDLQQCPLYVKAGRLIAPFGISTGDPVADVLNIENPLTVEVFEMREDAIQFGYEILRPSPPTETVMVTPVSAEPLLFAPLFRSLGECVNRRFCYPEMRRLPRPQAQIPIPICTLYTYNAGILFFNGDTQTGFEDQIEHMGATAGYQVKGYGWSFDADVDFTTSVFDSNFLQFEYRGFRDQISYIAGMAAHIKASRGPVSVIAEWNSALQEAEFVDDAGNAVSIAPEAWQVSMAYQFDWNPLIDIGSQGTYVAVSYSQSDDLAGVTRELRRVEPGLVAGAPGLTIVESSRVGFVPRERFLISVGEWVTDGLRLAFEYSHVVDYSAASGGTGASADGWFGMLTYVW